MAKKTKKQKRKAKVSAKAKGQRLFKQIKDSVRVGSMADLKKRMPDKQERINYLTALIKEFEIA